MILRCFILTLILSLTVNSHDLKGLAPSNQQVLHKYTERDIPIWLTGLLDWYTLFFPTNQTSAGVSSECTSSVNIYQQGVSSLSSEAAVSMFDASGKIPDGLAVGNTYVLGSYEACVQINDQELRGKYCKGSIRFHSDREEMEGKGSPSKMLLDLLGERVDGPPSDVAGSLVGVIAQSWSGLSWGICVPASCTADDIRNHTNTVLSLMMSGPVSASASFYSQACFTSDHEISFDSLDVVFTVLMSVLIIIIIISTVMDLWTRYGYFIMGTKQPKFDWTPEKTSDKLIASFSIYRNGSKLLDCKESSSCIRCLHGIRFISMTWVIYGHGNINLIINNTIQSTVLKEVTENIHYQVMFNAYLAVDTFFFLSGFLLSYLLVKELQRSKGEHLLVLVNTYLHRYLRLTPAYLAVIGFLATIRNKMFENPPSYNSSTEESCRKLWWKMVLYIHTLFDGETGSLPEDSGSCMAQSWYLSVDMQLFLIGPLIIIITFYLRRLNKTASLIFAASITLIFILIPGILTWIYDLAPTDVLQRDNPGVEVDQHKIIYKKPWCRAAPYIIGIWLGFWFNERKGKLMPKLPGTVVLLGWVVVFVVGLLIEYGMFPYNKFEPASYSKLTAISYATLHRPAWALCLSWVVLTCHAGLCGPINSFLSWPAFIPLSRLTYSAYLVHFIVLDLFWHNTRPMYKDSMIMSWIFVTNVMVSLAFAAILALAVEMPAINLDKILLAAISGRKKNTEEKREKEKTSPVKEKA